MKTSLKNFCFILLLMSATSCGVIFGGSRFSGSVIVKDHPKADIYVDGRKIGKGSAMGSFPRNRPLAVEIKEKECESQTRTFNKSFRTGNFILSILSWGLVGVAVDLGTGASYKPDHRHDPSINRLSDKSYVFIVDYSGCPD